MRDEFHRAHSLDIFGKYQNGLLECKSLVIGTNTALPIPEWENCIYVLRVHHNASKCASLLNIPNQMDQLGILYIGGHESGRPTGRFNKAIRSARKSEQFYMQNNHAQNDCAHEHPIGGCLTTSILESGFSIADCKMDLIKSGFSLGFDELELLIGYQETFHHLPPWNSTRGGASGYQNSQNTPQQTS